MPRPPIDPGVLAERARHIIETRDDVDAIRIAQATLLPMLGLTLEQTGQAIGLVRFCVSRMRNRKLS